MSRRPPRPPLFPNTTPFGSTRHPAALQIVPGALDAVPEDLPAGVAVPVDLPAALDPEQVDPTPRCQVEPQGFEPNPFALRHPGQLVALNGHVGQPHRRDDLLGTLLRQSPLLSSPRPCSVTRCRARFNPTPRERFGGATTLRLVRFGVDGLDRTRSCSTRLPRPIVWWLRDRKSTRLNSSHANISYAVFCLKK